jgi:hypothetical protein
VTDEVSVVEGTGAGGGVVVAGGGSGARVEVFSAVVADVVVGVEIMEVVSGGADEGDVLELVTSGGLEVDLKLVRTAFLSNPRLTQTVSMHLLRDLDALYY